MKDLHELWMKFLIWAGLKKLSFRDKLPLEAREHYDALTKMFSEKRDPLRSTSNTVPGIQVAVESSRQREARKAHMWIVELANINSFLACEFRPPSAYQNDSEVSYSPVIISFYEAMDSSVKNIIDLLGKTQDLKLKLVNHVGETVEEWHFQVRPISIHPMMSLDYHSSEAVKWQLECECLKWEIRGRSNA